MSLTTRVTAAAVALSFASAALAQTAPPKPAPPDTKDPAVARDTTHYNLPKHEAGKPALAIEGYDPVSYYPEGGGKPAKGKTEFVFTYRAVEYRFASKENLDKFKSDPARYEPAYGGWCASAMADGGRKVEIDPKAFKITGGRLFLFYTDLFSDARSYWNKDEPKNTVAADDHWKKIAREEPRKPEAGGTSPGPDAPKKP